MLNKKTDKYLVAKRLLDFKMVTKEQGLSILHISNISARISELTQMGLPIDSVLKKIVKANGKRTTVRDYYCIRKGCVGKFRKRFKELTK